MKNKSIIYVLLLAVALIWSVIIYKIYSGVLADEEPEEITAPRIGKKNYNDLAIPNDTFRLDMKYRDPFRQVSIKSSPAAIESVPLAHPAVKAPEINWDFIQYYGFISNPSSRKITSLIRANGKNLMLNEGETADRITVIKNYKDSIKIRFNNHIKTIKRLSDI